MKGWMYMKISSIYIDYSNKEQVKWWNNFASGLVTVTVYNEIIEVATNKPVGRLICLKGVLRNYVINKNNTFLKDPRTVVIKD